MGLLLDVGLGRLSLVVDGAVKPQTLTVATGRPLVARVCVFLCGGGGGNWCMHAQFAKHVRAANVASPARPLVSSPSVCSPKPTLFHQPLT